MADKETNRLRPWRLSHNNDAVAALQTIAAYAPNNPDLAVAKGLELIGSMNAARSKEAQAAAALKTARDNATAAEWAVHKYVLGIKDQVAAQFGKSSNEYQSLGLKKKTEYKRPSRKKRQEATD